MCNGHPKLDTRCRLLVQWRVAVEKVPSMVETPKLGDQKCIPRWRKPFIRHPSASVFQRNLCEGLFQQPRLIATVEDLISGLPVIRGRRPGPAQTARTASFPRSSHVVFAAPLGAIEGRTPSIWSPAAFAPRRCAGVLRPGARRSAGLHAGIGSWSSFSRCSSSSTEVNGLRIGPQVDEGLIPLAL